MHEILMEKSGHPLCLITVTFCLDKGNSSLTFYVVALRRSNLPIVLIPNRYLQAICKFLMFYVISQRVLLRNFCVSWR